MKTGVNRGYFWLTTIDYSLHDVITACPQTVIGRRNLAVASFDSGPLSLNGDEISAGWQSRGGIAYSPKVESIDKLPHDLFDEWYVFPEARDLGHLYEGNIFEASIKVGQVAAFVNFGPGFNLGSAEAKGLADLFWCQLELIQPETFISDGDILNFVTRDGQLFEFFRGAFA